MNPVYFDNNATTRPAPEVVAAMLPFFQQDYGNPSSPHSGARAPALALDDARRRLARLIGAPDPARLVFTSGGTESNAAALHAALAARPDRREVVFSAVEHASVIGWRQRLVARGYRVHRIPVHRDGSLDGETLDRVITDNTALVSVMLANNETGVIYPVQDVARRARAVGALVHTDAAQAVGKIPVNVNALGVDYATVCGHKFHAPKGVGALYIKTASGAEALMAGGGQEGGLRPGTEPVPLIAGLGVASALAGEWLAGDGGREMQDRRDAFEADLLARCPGAVIAGHQQLRLPNTSLVLLPGQETETLLARLDMAGICVSSGSACASGAHEPSHVLAAMGVDASRWGVVRISASRFNDLDEWPLLIDVLAG